MATSVLGDGTFRSPRAKIERAKRHLSELERAVWSYVDAAGPSWVKEQSGTVIAYRLTRDAPEPPVELSVIVGDVLHNLRAALDQAASELVRLNGGDDAKVHFPFCDTPDFLEEMIKNRNFHLAGAKAVEIVEDLEPYKGGNVLLRAIHDLNILDKHRAMLEVSREVSSPAFRLGPESEPAGTTYRGTVGLNFPFESAL